MTIGTYSVNKKYTPNTLLKQSSFICEIHIALPQFHSPEDSSMERQANDTTPHIAQKI
jgi:hypothetical protein